MALSKHDQVSDMLVRAAELQRRSYGVKNDEFGSEEDDGEEEVVVEEDNGELGSGRSEEKMSGGESDNENDFQMPGGHRNSYFNRPDFNSFSSTDFYN